jgi:hypothetical protein
VTAKVRQGRRPRGRVADRLQNSSLEEKRHCERYMCALRARASLGRFVVMRCSVSHIMSIGPRAPQMVGVLRALQTLMHADLAACVPLLSQVRNAMVRAAPRKADDRHLLRQCPERAHRHHRCPTGLTPEAHHVSPRAATPSPPASADADALRRLAGGWQASCSNCRPRPPQHGPGRTAPILPPCAHRAAPRCPRVAPMVKLLSAARGGCTVCHRAALCWRMRRQRFLISRGRRGRRAADAAPHLRSPLTRSPLAQFHGQHVYDRVSVH